MRGQTFRGSENCRVRGETLRRRASHLLVRCPANEVACSESRITPRQSAGGQNVIASGYVVAEHHRRLLADEHAAGVSDVGEHTFRILERQQQVLGSELVREFDRVADTSLPEQARLEAFTSLSDNLGRV